MEKNIIHIKKDQIKALEKLIADSEITFDDLINEIKNSRSKSSNKITKTRNLNRKKALSVIGKYKSKEGDISVNHDKYLNEDYK